MTINLKRNKIGIKLKKIREAAHLTQDNLAEILDYSVDTISRIETGKASMSEKFREAVSKYFNINESYFFISDDKDIISDKQILLQEIDTQLSELDLNSLKAIQSIIRTIKINWINNKYER